MFQNFESEIPRGDYKERINLIRSCLIEDGLDGFILPRTDAHQNEFIEKHDARLEWATGFTGSAGKCLILVDFCYVFVDGRYSLQVEREIDPKIFRNLDSGKVSFYDWLKKNFKGRTIGVDPRLHSASELLHAKKICSSKIKFKCCENPVDKVWKTQPKPSKSLPKPHQRRFSGEDYSVKKQIILKELSKNKADVIILTKPESVCWLLNIRGKAIKHFPVVKCFFILNKNGEGALFLFNTKISSTLRKHLGASINIQDINQFTAYLTMLKNLCVQLDLSSCSFSIYQCAKSKSKKVIQAKDPCELNRAIKNKIEIKGCIDAHLIDGLAFTKFLYWFDGIKNKETLDEIRITNKIELLRRNTGQLKDIAFDTICASGKNAAMAHYRVTENTNRQLEKNSLLLIDSGGQYEFGTTDLTRTISVGRPGPEMIKTFTLVLKGMIAVSQLRWPAGLTGKEIDILARTALWRHGYDYDHGTGHGIGSYLSVHEGPQAISRKNNVPLRSGMILSNEPGYYKPGYFGIRIENILLVTESHKTSSFDKNMLRFKTLTTVPLDKKLIDPTLLSDIEKDWINAYHTKVFKKLGEFLNADSKSWLKKICEPI